MLFPHLLRQLLVLASLAAHTGVGGLRRAQEQQQPQCTNQVGRGAPAPTVAGCQPPVLRVTTGTIGSVEAYYQARPGYTGGGTLRCASGSWVALNGQSAPRCFFQGCTDDATWRSQAPFSVPCERTSWSLCAENKDEDGVYAAVACPLTCGTCEMVAGLAEGTRCADDPTWRDVGTGMSCLSLEQQRIHNHRWNPRLRCPRLRSQHVTAVQACPHACTVCVNTTSAPSAADTYAASVGAGTAEAGSWTAGSTATTTTTPFDWSSIGGVDEGNLRAPPPPPPPQIRLGTPVGTLLPVLYSAWELDGLTYFADLDTVLAQRLGTFVGASTNEALITFPPGDSGGGSSGGASLRMPSNVFGVFSPGTFVLQAFVWAAEIYDGPTIGLVRMQFFEDLIDAQNPQQGCNWTAVDLAERYHSQQHGAGAETASDQTSNSNNASSANRRPGFVPALEESVEALPSADSSGGVRRGEWVQLQSRFELPASHAGLRLPLCARLVVGPPPRVTATTVGVGVGLPPAPPPHTRGMLRVAGIGLRQLGVTPLTRQLPVYTSETCSADGAPISGE